jgi:PAS domain S-box-containing protein
MSEPSYLGLIQNAALLLALVFLFDLMLGKRRLENTRFWQVLLGILLGGVGVILMNTPWVLALGVIFDTRSVLLGISGLFFGPIPTIIAMVIAAAFRIYQGGAAVWMGVCVILASGIIGILWGRFLRKPLEALSGWDLYLFGLLIHFVMLACAFVLPWEMALQVLKNIVLPVLLIYPLATLALGLLLIGRLRRERMTEERIRSEVRLKSLVAVLQKPMRSVQEFLDFSLEQAIRLTNSKIGYIYFYSEDRKEFILNTWSKGVMDECAVLNPQTCYELEKTGVWGEAVRQQKPILINNFEADNPLRKGYPEGHVRLNKFLTVPVFNQEHIVAVVGVANKATDYDESDVLQLTLLMDGVWKAVEREKAEEGQRQSDERYAAIVNNLPNALIHIFDREFRYVFNAGQGLASAGLTNEMLVGKSVFDILGSELGHFVAEHYQRVLAGEVVHFEGQYTGQYFVVHAAPLRDKQGNITQILALSLDITVRRKAEEELQHAQSELKQLLSGSEQARRALRSVLEDQKTAEEKLKQLNSELEQRVQERTAQLATTNKELEAFAYSVSHDLRAPLRALDGFSAALLADYQDQLDDQGKHFLARIQEASRRMGQLIEDLLNLSRVTRREMNLEPVDLSTLALEVAHDLQTQVSERSIEFDITPNLLVRADPNLLKIALVNLLSNALKFSGKRTRAHIQIGMIEQSGKPVYYVSDNGVGFNMAYAGKLFAPFQRLHSVQEFPGTGIGLVIVQRIIARHGGRLWPEAAVDQGATFYFTLESE